jgi:hypothetical protein
MNRKQLILLLVALAVFGGAWLMMRNRNQQSWEPSGTRLGQKVLPDFQMNNVAAIHIKGDGELDLAKKNDKWRVSQRNDYPANFSGISDLLIKMEGLKIAQAEPIGPSQLGRMHLAEPGAGPEAAALVEFKDERGKVLQSLLLGKTHTRQSGRPSPMSFGNGEMPDGRFVMLKSNPGEVLTVSDPLDSVDPKPATWLNKDFFKVEKPQSISFVSTIASNSWTLTRAAESSPWVLSDIKPGEVLDSNKVSSLASTLGYPSFVDVATNAVLDKPLLVTITTFDHFAYTLKIGSKTAANDYNMTVAVSADFPKERVAGKDEKPDDKKKLDKEFSDKLKLMEDKLKQEAALDHWTYLVNNWLIDPLIRDRAQLMLDKNAGKKGGKPSTDASTEPASSDDKPDAGMPASPLDPNGQ